MAAVGAIKTLEAMKEVIDPSVKAGTPMHSPGLCVQIVYNDGRLETIGPRPAPPLQIEGEAERDALEPPGR
jgi:hypothetical protein